jgi:hypothetical protein
MMQINNTIAKRNAGPNHEGKFSRAFKKFSPVIAEMRQFSAKSKSTRVLRGSDRFSDMAFAIWYVSICTFQKNDVQFGSLTNGIVNKNGSSFRCVE